MLLSRITALGIVALSAASGCVVETPAERVGSERIAPERGASVPRGGGAPVSGLPRENSPGNQRADRQGRFKVVRLEARDPNNIKTRDSKLLEEIIRDMNATIGPRLPVDVAVGFAELGQANAFYTPQKRAIVVSYELLNQMIVLFAKNADRDDPRVAARVAQQVIDTLSFVVYHEAAHAMIDLCELPITGKEEDAADQLATVMIVSSANAKYARAQKSNGITQAAQGGDAAINGALYFLLSSRGSGRGVKDLPFWDEHSLSEQRFYNILTWVLGSDPERHAHLVQKRILPERRAAGAPREYAQMLRSWSRILKDARAI